LTGKRTVKIALAVIWAAGVVVLIALAVGLLKSFTSAPEETVSIIPIQAPVKPEEREVILFFADADAASLLPEKRLLPLGSSLESNADAIVNELIKGPQVEGSFATIPADTRLTNVYRVGDVLVVDFSRELQMNHPGGSAGELITVYSIVNTLTDNLHGIKKVQILVDGAEMETLAGHMDLSKPLSQDTKWMKVLSHSASAYSGTSKRDG